MSAGIEGGAGSGVVTPASQGTIATTLAGISGYAWGVVAITAAALASRVILLGTVPRLWGDEAFTGVAVRHSVLGMLDVVRHDNHPPLAYLLIRAVAVVSTSPTALRLVSAVAGTAAVPLAAALGRRVRGDWAGLLAAAAVASFPQFLLTSRDTRMYALATALVLATSLTLWRAIEKPSRERLLVYAICVSAAVYSHYFAVMAVGAQLLVALAVFRPPAAIARRLVLACAAGSLTLVPWLVAAQPQFQHIGAPFWIPRVTWATVLPDIGGLAALPQRGAIVAQWVAEAGAVVLVVLLWRRLPRPGRAGVLYLAAGAAVPTLALLLVSLWKPLYDPRFAGIFWGSAVVVLGVSLTLFRQRAIAVAMIGLLAVTALAALLQIDNPDYQALLSPINGRVGDRDVVVVNGPNHYFSVAYALGTGSAGAIKVVAGDIPWFFGVAGYPPGTHVDSVPDASRIYVVSDQGQTTPTLPSGYRQVDHTCDTGVCLDAYSR